MSIHLFAPNNDLSKIIVSLENQKIAELNAEGFESTNDIVKSVNYQLAPHQFESQCIFGCSHHLDGHLITLINQKAESSLKMKSVTPECQIFSAESTCAVFSIENDKAESQPIPIPLSMIEIFVSRAIYNPPRA